METSKQKLRIVTKECAYVGCTNTFEGSQFQKYCKDQACIDARIESRNKTRKLITNLDAE